MGESPTNCRLKLSGGQQAKRHRAVCNRGHGIFSLCDEVQDQRNAFERPHLDYDYERSVGATQLSNSAVSGQESAP